MGHLLSCGAVRRDDSARKRSPQPLWWSNQTAERKAEFKKKDAEVNIFLRRQKRSSFRLFCESMDPSQGMCRIWGTLKALTSRAGAMRTNVITDPNSAEFERLRTDLVREEVSPADIPLWPLRKLKSNWMCLSLEGSLIQRWQHVKRGHRPGWMASRTRF